MREYRVKYGIEKQGERTYETIPVKASSSEEAIELIKDYLQEQVIQNSEYTAEIKKNCVYVLDDEEVVEIYCNFSTESEIRKAREEADLSRAEMARMFEIPIRTLEDWEYGKNIPSHWAEKLILEKLEMMSGKHEGAGDE